MSDWPPLVSVSAWDALWSESARAERDRQLAASCGLNEDETRAFLRRLAEFDANTPVFEARLRAERERAALEAELRYADARRKLRPTVEA